MKEVADIQSNTDGALEASPPAPRMVADVLCKSMAAEMAH